LSLAALLQSKGIGTLARTGSRENGVECRQPEIMKSCPHWAAVFCNWIYCVKTARQ